MPHTDHANLEARLAELEAERDAMKDALHEASARLISERHLAPHGEIMWHQVRRKTEIRTVDGRPKLVALDEAGHARTRINSATYQFETFPLEEVAAEIRARHSHDLYKQDSEPQPREAASDSATDDAANEDIRELIKAHGGLTQAMRAHRSKDSLAKMTRPEAERAELCRVNPWLKGQNWNLTRQGQIYTRDRELAIELAAAAGVSLPPT